MGTRSFVDRVEVLREPHQIFNHTDDKLGPTGTTEWQAFIADSEGNTVGLVSFAIDEQGAADA